MVSSTPALPEHWTELNAARKNRRLCAEDVAAIKKSCEVEAGVKHVAESPPHWSEALDRMLGRYKDSQDREWFSERRAVVFGLEDMFAEAKAWKTSLGDIEASIGSEKEAWYRWVLRRYPEFLAVACSGVDQDEVRSILDDPDRSREELVAMVSRAVGMSEDWSSRVDAFADKVAAAGGDAAVLKKLYIEEFFKDASTGETLPDAQKYLDMYESDPDARLEDMIDRIIAGNKEDRGSQAQRETHQKRLDQLLRARTAFEQKERDKSQQQGAQQANAVDEQYYSLPACSVCKKEVDASRVISCPLCQMVQQLGGQKGLTLYCSDECHDKGYDEHMDKEHGCEAGDRCVQEGDEDVLMEEDESAGAMACNECQDQNQWTLFCSRACAYHNLGRHRKSKHGLETEHAEELVSPVRQMIDMTLTEEKTGLKFEG